MTRELLAHCPIPVSLKSSTIHFSLFMLEKIFLIYLFPPLLTEPLGGGNMPRKSATPSSYSLCTPHVILTSIHTHTNTRIYTKFESVTLGCPAARERRPIPAAASRSYYPVVCHRLTITGVAVKTAKLRRRRPCASVSRLKRNGELCLRMWQCIILTGARGLFVSHLRYIFDMHAFPANLN